MNTDNTKIAPVRRPTTRRSARLWLPRRKVARLASEQSWFHPGDPPDALFFASGRALLALGHEGEDVALAVAEFGEPQIVIGHSRDHVRLADRVCALGHELACRAFDVLHEVVEDRARVVELLRFRRGE